MKYKDLTEYYQKIEAASKRLDKTYILAQLLKKAPNSELETIVLLMQGKIFPQYDERKIGVATKMAVKAIMVATGLDETQIEKEWKNRGDLGETAEELCKNKKQQTFFSQPLTIRKVFENLKKLAELEGPGSSDMKIKLLAELLGNASSIEAKYIIRTVLEDLRVGVKEGVLKDAIVWAYYPPVAPIFVKCNNCGKVMPHIDKCLECSANIDLKEEIKISGKILKASSLEDVEKVKNLQEYSFIVAKDEKAGREIYNWLNEKVEQAIELTNDYGVVASRCKAGSLDYLMKIGLVPGTPLKAMLFPKAKDMKDAMKQAGKPAAIEHKYDGFRIQVHRNGNDIKLFTRKLEDVTIQFPDVVEVVKTHVKSHDFILDGEIVSIDPKTNMKLSFQHISQRIKRKHNIAEMIKKLPVELYVFDVMELDGENYLKKSFKERRNSLELIIKPVKYQIYLAEQIVTDDIDEANKFYQQALREGHEGVMVKRLDAPYKPGSRIGHAFKVKPVMESLDLIIIGATWGEGKRGEWLSSFDLACRSGNVFLEIGKVGTGIKEKSEEGLSFIELTKLLKPLIREDQGKHIMVEPQIIIEVNFEEIQKSSTYNSGFALRFPRVIRMRPDKPVEDVSSIKQVERLFRDQRS